MFTKRKRLILSLLLVTALIGLALFVPLPSALDQVVTAAKLDENGSEISTVEIHITGTQYKSLFSNQLKSFVIHDFDGINQIGPLTLSRFTTDPLTGNYYITFAVGETDLDIEALGDAPLSDLISTSFYGCTVTLHKDLLHLLIEIRHGDGPTVFYACSLSEASESSQSVLDEMLNHALR